MHERLEVLNGEKSANQSPNVVGPGRLGQFRGLERAQFRARVQKGWGVAISGHDLAIGVAYAQNLGLPEALRVNMSFVNAYVLIRGKEAAVVDTGIPNNATKIADVVRTASLGWDAVRHVILTHYHPDHIGSVTEVSAAAPKATAYAGAPDIPRIESYAYPPRARWGDRLSTPVCFTLNFEP